MTGGRTGGGSNSTHGASNSRTSSTPGSISAASSSPVRTSMVTLALVATARTTGPASSTSPRLSSRATRTRENRLDPLIVIFRHAVVRRSEGSARQRRPAQHDQFRRPWCVASEPGRLGLRPRARHPRRCRCRRSIDTREEQARALGQPRSLVLAQACGNYSLRRAHAGRPARCRKDPTATPLGHLPGKVHRD